MTARLVLTEMTGADLEVGDLFTTADQHYWDQVFPGGNSRGSVGEKVYIRTAAPAPDPEQVVYRIEVVRMTVKAERTTA